MVQIRSGMTSACFKTPWNSSPSVTRKRAAMPRRYCWLRAAVSSSSPSCTWWRCRPARRRDRTTSPISAMLLSGVSTPARVPLVRGGAIGEVIVGPSLSCAGSAGWQIITVNYKRVIHDCQPFLVDYALSTIKRQLVLEEGRLAHVGPLQGRFAQPAERCRGLAPRREAGAHPSPRFRSWVPAGGVTHYARGARYA